MNNTNEDKTWQNLLGCAAPTFAGKSEPPYGFITATLAQLRAQKRQQSELERISWRALFASLMALVVVTGFTVSLQVRDRNDLDPGVNSIIQIQNVPLS